MSKTSHSYSHNIHKVKKTEQQLLIDYRKNTKLSQEEFAAKLGISRELQSKMESGKSPITSKTKKLIEKEFGKDFQSFMVMEDQAEYFTSSKNSAKLNSIELLSHNTIEIKAMLRMLLRTNSELLAASRGESVTKTISEISKGVEDEISACFSESKRKFG